MPEFLFEEAREERNVKCLQTRTRRVKFQTKSSVISRLEFWRKWKLIWPRSSTAPRPLSRPCTFEFRISRAPSGGNHGLEEVATEFRAIGFSRTETNVGRFETDRSTVRAGWKATNVVPQIPAIKIISACRYRFYHREHASTASIFLFTFRFESTC